MTRKKLKLFLPESTLANPLAELEYVMTRVAERFQHKDVAYYTHFKNYYARYLLEIFGASYILNIRIQWQPDELEQFLSWLIRSNPPGKPKSISDGTIGQLISRGSQLMIWAYDNHYIEEAVRRPYTGTPSRDTMRRAAYTDEECAEILDKMRPQLVLAETLARGYQPAGIGCDPRNLPPHEWNKASLIWVFENILECTPVKASLFPNTGSQMWCIKEYIQKEFGSINEWYKTLGVYPTLRSDVLSALALKLASETGLNAESIVALKRDCFVEEDGLTGQPHIKYWKKRGAGELIYHMTLMDGDSSLSQQPLKPKQSSIVRRTIQLILKLTEHLVHEAPEGEKDYLFLCHKQIKGGTTARRLTSKLVAYFCRERLSIVDGVRDMHNSSHNINLSRFRPTKVSQLVKQGYDLFAIQALLGHASVLSTIRYIDEHNLSTEFYAEITAHIEKIQENARKYRTIPIAATIQHKPGEYIFKTSGLCHCKDPFAPPERIRKATSFRAGQTCTYYNMCLTCPHVVITEITLPKLFVYAHQIKNELASGLLNDPRAGDLYKRSLVILDQIFKPDEIFSQRELEVARAISADCLDEIFDDFISG